MAVAVTINDIAVTGATGTGIRASSIQFTRPKRGRATGSFKSGTRFQLGQKVGIFDGGVRRFGGTIDEVKEVAESGTNYSAGHSGTLALDYEYLIVGWEQRLDNRLVSGVAYGGIFIADPTADTLTQYGHRLADGYPVQLATTTTLPAGLSAATTYYVRDATANDFKLAATLGGAAIDITDGGTGVHRLLWRSGNIIRSMVTEFAAGESVTLSSVSDGEFIEKVVFDYVPVMAALQTIADLTPGYTLFIDPTLVLKYYSGTVSAPFNITSASSTVFNLNVIRETREDYRNRQNLRLSDENALRTTETFPGDDVTQTFWLNGPASVIRSISDGTTAFTVGVDGVDSGFDFYWSEGSQLIRQDPSGTPIATGITLTVIYSTFENTVVLVQDTGAQAARAVIEGGSGVYERLESAPDGATVDAANVAAQAALDAFTIAKELEYQTLDTSFEPGMAQTVTLAAHSLSAAAFTVEDVAFSVEQGLMVCSVTATNARLKGAGEMFSSFQGGGGISSGGAIGGSGSGGGTSSGATTIPVTLTADATLNGPGAPADGAQLIYVITQNATGGWLVTWGTDFDASVDYAPNDSANAVTTYMFFGLGGKWYKFESGSIR